MTEIIHYCGDKVCLDGLSTMKSITRRDTLLEVAKRLRERAKYTKVTPRSLFRDGVQSALITFAQELDRMAEECK